MFLKLGLQLRFCSRDVEVAWAHPPVGCTKKPFGLLKFKAISFLISDVVILDIIHREPNAICIVWKTLHCN
jgi:hypothetical protein